MRLWSLHPRYLDSKGLVALWRESLLAQKVLRGQTKGYRHHPQLDRFKSTPAPVSAVATYLLAVYQEAIKREFSFDASKIGKGRYLGKISVTDGQLIYEMNHLMKKLWVRDRRKYFTLKGLPRIEAHPMLHTVAAGVAKWEVITG